MYSLTATAERRLSLDYDTQLKSTAKIDKEETHELPDRNVCIEVLFQPFPRIPESTILLSLQSNIKMRLKHPQRTVRLVVLSYGTTLFQGIFEGMIAGACSFHDEVKVVAPPTETSSVSALFVSIAPKCFFSAKFQCRVVR